MRRTWQALKDETMSPAAQRLAREMADKEIAMMEISELREALKIRQEDLAHKLKVSQVAVSQLENRDDLRISTLRDYITALGGQVEVLAIFPDRKVNITHVSLSLPKGSGKSGLAAIAAYRRRSSGRVREKHGHGQKKKSAQTPEAKA
jgi:transcriptional regulator with XRE-family HTH domain